MGTDDRTARYLLQESRRSPDDSGHARLLALLKSQSSPPTMTNLVPEYIEETVVSSTLLSEENTYTCDISPDESASQVGERHETEDLSISVVENDKGNSQIRTSPLGNISTPRRASFNITQYQLMRPHAPPLPRSQTLGSLSHLPVIVPVGTDGNGPVMASRLTKESTYEPINPRHSISKITDIPRSVPRRSTSVITSSQASQPGNPVLRKRTEDNERDSKPTGIPKAVLKEKQATASLVKSQSALIPPVVTDSNGGVERMKLRGAGFVNLEHRIRSFESNYIFNGRKRDPKTPPRTLRRTPPSRELRNVGSAKQCFEERKISSRLERSPSSERYADTVASISTHSALQREISDPFITPPTIEKLGFHATKNSSQTQEIPGYTSLSTAVAAQERRYSFGETTKMPSPIVAKREIIRELSRQSGFGINEQHVSRIPTSWVSEAEAGKINQGRDNGPALVRTGTLERQYRPSARMSLNYPSAVARTPSLEDSTIARTPSSPPPRLSFGPDFDLSFLESPTPQYAHTTNNSAQDERNFSSNINTDFQPLAFRDSDAVTPECTTVFPQSSTEPVNTFMPSSWWLGRFTSIVNRLRTEALNQQVERALRVGASDLGAEVSLDSPEHPSNQGWLNETTREGAAFEDLRGLCRTEAAHASLDAFQRVHRMRQVQDVPCSIRAERKRVAEARRYGVNPLKLTDLRIRAEAQRVRAKKMQNLRGDGGTEPQVGQNSMGAFGMPKDSEPQTADRLSKPEGGRKVSVFGKLAMGRRKFSGKE